MMSEINKRVVILGLCAFVMAIVVVAKMCYISFAQGSDIRQAVDDKAYYTEFVTAFGGNVIGDDFDALLAYYYPSSEVRWNAVTAKKNIEGLSLDTLKRLGKLFDDNFSYKSNNGSYYKLFEKAYKNDLTNQLIMSDVKSAEEKKVRSFPILRESRGGLMITSLTEMKFTSNKIGNRTLGKTNFDESANSKVGLIGTYRETLKGETMSKDVFRGGILPAEVTGNLFPDEGCDVITTVNYDISEITYNALNEQLKRVKGGKGCAIVMEVETGDVKAMINLQRRRNGDTVYTEQTNLAYAYAYEPGSVFKLASFLVALKDGYIDLDREMSIGRGVMEFPGKVVRDSHTYPEEQVWSMRKIFAHSSNVGAAKVIYNNYKDNPQKFVDGLNSLHVGDYIETDILSSARSRVKGTDSKEWWRTSLYQMAQGYEVMITPINLTMLYNAVANDGVMMKPRYVKALRDKEYDEIEYLDVEVVDTICSLEVAQKAQELLREVVVAGTATRAFKNAPYNFSGKTGTAQIKAEKVYSATFIGYFPAENPKYTIYVMLTDLYHEYYASTVAAPVARNIADKLYAIDKSFFKTITVDSTKKTIDEIICNLN